MTTPLPDWMPPISINNDSKYYPDQVARMMRDYALAAVEAYKASRVPVAWIDAVGNIDRGWDVLYGADGWTPLYRLD